MRLVTSTAHYSKFVEECEDIYLREKIEKPTLHEDIEKCKDKGVVHDDCIEANYDSVCHEVTKFIEHYFVNHWLYIRIKTVLQMNVGCSFTALYIATKCIENYFV